MRIRFLAAALIGVALAFGAQSVSAVTAPSLLAQVNATGGVEVYARSLGGVVNPTPLAPAAPCQLTRGGRICVYQASDAGFSISGTLQITQSATATQFRWLRVQSGGGVIVPLSNSVDVLFLGNIRQVGNAITPPQGGWPSQAVQINAVTSGGQTQITYTKPATCFGSPCTATLPGFVPIRLVANPSGDVSVEAP